MIDHQKWMAPLYNENPTSISCKWTGENSIREGCFNRKTSAWSMGGLAIGGIGGGLAFGPLGILGGIAADLIGACAIGAIKAAVEYCE